MYITVSADGDQYIPCKSFISFSYDDSNFIRNDEFKTQINFIKNAIGTLNHPERLRAEGGYTAEFNWNSGLSIAQEQSSFDFSQQTLMSYSLLQQFASLVTSVETLDATSDPIGALIFISDTSDRALANAARFLPQLSSVRLTFVLIGPDADQTKLTNFSSNFIYWTDLSQPQPDNWDSALYGAYGCSGSMSTVTIPAITTTTSLPLTTTTSTMTPSTVTGSTIQPYLPCQSWISFSYDDSKTLPNNNFKIQMSFISSVIGSINYPYRLRIQGAFTDVASFNSGQTVAQMQTELSNSIQTENAYSLLMEFANLVNYLPTNNWPVAAVIFISDTSDQALKNAYRFMPQLSGVELTFVLLGSNVDSSKLTNFSSNFIYWSDLSQPKPDNWDTVSLNALGCTNPSSVSFPPSGSTPSLPPPSTTGQGFTGTTAMPYVPCQSWISFSYDDSSALQNTDFKTQMSFILSAIGNINYPDRLHVDGAFTNVASWNSHQTIAQMQTELNSLEQTAISYSLLQQFAALLTDVEAIGNSQNWPIGALIFISDTSDAALANANIFFNQLPPTVKLTFVLLGPNADQTKLTNFSSNFISWKDLTQPQPNSWDTLSYAAFGCQ
uniref:VWFA domain-containing protein n=1 Tax=Panagrolaimus sp. ES5 TaxID=591445 RepID=A0AC34GUS0_9BILA